MSALRTALFVLIFMTPAIGTAAEPQMIQPLATSVVYRVTKLTTASGIEYRCYHLTHHFLSVLFLKNGSVAVRPHPSTLSDAWGTTWYLPIALSSGQPSRTVGCSVSANATGITVTSSGQVDRGGNRSYGSWNVSLRFTFDPKKRIVAATGSASTSLAGTLASAQSDLVLGRLASNYLVDVPIQGSAARGITGDMKNGLVRYAASSTTPNDFNWLPEKQPSHYPNARSSYLSIQLVGQTNKVDTLKLGAGFQIKVAPKPSVTVAITSRDDGLSAGMQFDLSKSRDFSADNIGVSHLILRGGKPLTRYGFTITMQSVP